jgi:kumamolisin
MFSTHFRRSPAFAAPRVGNGFGNTAPFFAQYYNFPPQPEYPPVIAVVSLGGTVQQSDLTYYWSTVCGLAAGQLPKLVQVAVGGAVLPIPFTRSGADMENTLDCSIIGGIVHGATILLISAPNTNAGFYAAVSAAISGVPVNNVLLKPVVCSISWGAAEQDFPSTTSVIGGPSIMAWNKLFQLGVSQQVQFCCATGDSGSGDSTAGLAVDFPASSPWCLSCGGTSVTATGENAWSWNAGQNWGGGGGISSQFPMPTYQLGTAMIFNTSFRTTPDISFNADPLNGWTIQFGGQLLVNGLGGTSCASPCAAGMLALFALWYPLGVNSALYSVYWLGGNNRAQCYKDIVNGNNDSLQVGGPSYACLQGYDLCTGMGSVNGINLLNAIKNFSTSVPVPA